jgi:hypothetical protein
LLYSELLVWCELALTLNSSSEYRWESLQGSQKVPPGLVMGIISQKELAEKQQQPIWKG